MPLHSITQTRRIPACFVTDVLPAWDAAFPTAASGPWLICMSLDSSLATEGNTPTVAVSSISAAKSS
jgi:hypothetical protein